ncbi:MAG: site-2 protease family protein [Ignavibacteria bacterium CG_4_8_14_3_um_filter_37_9]|nr:site-2 protease family protein [Ignavibacteria bacterium]OIO14191.1 MAG: peptidase [Ignavibacteria bacterium CG1_02_37_35]PIP79175.1 MAG: peptidase [Ignavibacteria bacterium CG22_combo_CG10-13_8_21_14_all_37_15]PIS43705.1 MAG: site-2 protease family protein [Ignavibacteria bacterium CG08_land_8_20_14_0_20_37_9]PIW98932.1 MAG: site-2 protease family protein [Ignavibacteria bacterium CG_4_8_14_3_um_filter_37_9]PIX93724.1 MAG: site-2 protease family protein [Ignavibacteria bacterium CG_4_10_14
MRNIFKRRLGYQSEFSEKESQKYWLHILLFLATLFTTTVAGHEWIRGFSNRTEFTDLIDGFPYSFSILFVLGTHEFGHYFAAKIHKVKATLPYFIPFPSLLGFLNFGTLGAVIKIKSPIPTKKALFDIGVAGPIAGFIASVILIIYGFTHLPAKEYLLQIHPDYNLPTYGKDGLALVFGDSLLFSFLREVFTSSKDFIPPMSEIYHYPYLCVGWFGFFVTAMNLIPVGQLDGGHIVYALFGEKKQYAISSVALIFLIVFGVLGILISYLALPLNVGWTGWLLWAVILFFIVKVKHPPINDDTPLDRRRKIIGYLTIVMFVVCFIPAPFIIF